MAFADEEDAVLLRLVSGDALGESFSTCAAPVNTTDCRSMLEPRLRGSSSIDCANISSSDMVGRLCR